ncbi:MAG: hypothetical protein WC389_12970 [Lutibacter sp.]|jgi:hypothetical protein
MRQKLLYPDETGHYPSDEEIEAENDRIMNEADDLYDEERCENFDWNFF